MRRTMNPTTIETVIMVEVVEWDSDFRGVLGEGG